MQFSSAQAQARRPSLALSRPHAMSELSLLLSDKRTCSGRSAMFVMSRLGVSLVAQVVWYERSVLSCGAAGAMLVLEVPPCIFQTKVS